MDAIEITLFVKRINAICEEMGNVLMRTAFSPNIKDRLDFSCAVFDAEGQLCAQAAHIPVHLGSMAYAMADIVNKTDWQPGDMLILNNPYLGGTHLPDVTLIAPVFHQQDLLAFVANRAHHADIGSSTPGSMPLANTLEEEGLVISPTFIMREHKICKKTLNHLLDNLHNPKKARPDFIAQISANSTGVIRLSSLIDSMGKEKFLAALVDMNDYAETMAKSVLSDIPQGSYTFTDIMDDDGKGNQDIPIQVTVTIRSDNINIDFNGTSPQTEGNINCPLSVAAAAVYYCFYCLMPRHTPACAGTFRIISITAPEKSLVNANYPAAVAAGNVETSTRIVDVILGAMARVIPDNIPAASHGSMNNIAMGAAQWDYYETLGGGMGASRATQGLDAIQTHMTNTLNTPIEIVEKYYPLRIRQYALRYRSGGKGAHYGGSGQIREYEFLEPCQVTLLTERRNHSPWGLAGGEPGEPGLNLLNEKPIPAKTGFSVAVGDRLTILTAGGGGWGAPFT